MDKPLENRVSAVDTGGDLREQENEGKHVTFKEPSSDDGEELEIRVPKIRADQRIVLDNDSEEEGIQPTPFEPLQQQGDGGMRRRKTVPAPSLPSKHKAYKLVSKMNDPNIVDKLVEQTKRKVLEDITVEMLVAMNSDYAKKLRDITFKTRVPVHQNFMFGGLEQESVFPFMEEGVTYKLQVDVICIDNLPRVDSLLYPLKKTKDWNQEGWFAWILCYNIILC